MQTCLVDLLVRQDKMTMAHSVENRVPFLDRPLVELARALPSRSLVSDSVTRMARPARATTVVLEALAVAHATQGEAESLWIALSLEIWAQQFLDGRRAH